MTAPGSLCRCFGRSLRRMITASSRTFPSFFYTQEFDLAWFNVRYGLPEGSDSCSRDARLRKSKFNTNEFFSLPYDRRSRFRVSLHSVSQHSIDQHRLADAFRYRRAEPWQAAVRTETGLESLCVHYCSLAQRVNNIRAVRLFSSNFALRFPFVPKQCGAAQSPYFATKLTRAHPRRALR